MSEETKKEGFFKKFLKSIKDFDKYEDFALEKPAEGLKYLIKLVAILCFIVCIAYTYKTITNMNNLYLGVKEKIPDFSYQSGTIEVASDDPVIIEEYGDMLGTIIIDTKIDSNNIEEEYSNNINKYGSAIVFTKEKVLLYSPQINGQVAYKYSDILSTYNISEFTKQDAINYIENMNVISIALGIYCMMYIYMFILYFASIAIDVLILLLLAYIVGRFSRLKLKFAPAFGIAVHSITLPVLLNLIYIIVNLFTGFEIKYFQIMYSTISYIYVIVAILMIKTDFLNRQVELMKLAQEQMKIKEEMKQQEDEEERRQEDQNKPVEKDNKKEKEDVEKDNSAHPEENDNKKENKKRKKTEKPSDRPVGDASSEQIARE